ncbi:MAG: hypothetical protein AAFV01_01955 [Bacteroidota bacterium]
MMQSTIFSRALSLGTTGALLLAAVFVLAACDTAQTPSPDVSSSPFADASEGGVVTNPQLDGCPDPTDPSLEFNLGELEELNVYFTLGELGSQGKVHACFETADNFAMVVTYRPQRPVTFRFIPKKHPYAHIWNVEAQYLLDGAKTHFNDVEEMGRGRYEARAISVQRPSSVHYSRFTKNGDVVYSKRYDYNQDGLGQPILGGSNFTDPTPGIAPFNATDQGFGYRASQLLKFQRLVLISDAAIDIDNVTNR